MEIKLDESVFLLDANKNVFKVGVQVTPIDGTIEWARIGVRCEDGSGVADLLIKGIVPANGKQAYFIELLNKYHDFSDSNDIAAEHTFECENLLEYIEELDDVISDLTEEWSKWALLITASDVTQEHLDFIMSWGDYSEDVAKTLLAIAVNEEMYAHEIFEDIDSDGEYRYEVYGKTYWAGEYHELNEYVKDCARNDWRDDYLEMWKQAVQGGYTEDGFEQYIEDYLEYRSSYKILGASHYNEHKILGDFIDVIEQ